MPYLMRTPEAIFREEKKDLYVIHATEAKNSHKGIETLREWVTNALLGTKMETIGPSVHSGYIMGGPTGLRIDFTQEGLTQFVAEWEETSGKSKDPRFQCYIYPYERWYQKHGRWIPTLDKPHGVGKSVWWHTPVGFVHHQLTQEDFLTLDEESQQSYSHPASPRDIWMHAVDLWPEKFRSLNTDALTYGRIFWSDRDQKWHVLKVEPLSRNSKEKHSIPAVQEILEWFNLPADTSVENDDF